ncbi:MAG: patatin-like phospholipase family protein [Anaerolineales bacterium]
MTHTRKQKRRGFVMTGGGAKGLYEAGVIHAFHLTGMEFDVITGSSIGAMNSLFFAEYLYRKRQLPAEAQRDPLQAIESLDGLVKAFHHAWLLIPDKHVIDDSEAGPIGQLKNDLLHFNLTLPQVTDLAWWLTDPDKGSLPPLRLWPILLRLLMELAERLGGAGKLLQLIKHHRQDFVRQAARTYLARFGLEYSLVPDGTDNKIKDVFTLPVSPLRAEHLSGPVGAPDDPQTKLYSLVDPARTLRDYHQAGIDVRLTRANYRTGRLEVSAHVPVQEFARFLNKHAWRIEVRGPEKLPLGSFRLQVPGNPVAINAAICSGRFPGVFRPYRLLDLYPASDDENKLLYRLADGWLADPEVTAKLKPEFQRLNTGPMQGEKKWADWQHSESMRHFFPMTGDTYVDGGSIDNTPYNSAVDFVRESLAASDGSTREVMLELYVIYLGTEPMVPRDEAKDPAIFEVVSRTLAILGAAKEPSTATTFDVINTFGKRAEQVGQVLELVLGSYQETLQSLDAAGRQRVEDGLRRQAQALGQRGFIGTSPDGILDRISQWTSDELAHGLPLQVEAVKIYPEEMPLDTLQFTERLGYKKDNAIQMLTMGCYKTLDTLRTRLEPVKAEDLDEQDQVVLTLARKWTGDGWQPPDPAVPEKARPVWHCQRTACVFHATACRHGAASARAAG